MKILGIIVILLITLMQLNAQDFTCDTPTETVNLKSSDCSDWNLYSPVDPFATPIKNVRVTIHVIQKNNGSDNFPDNSTSRDWIQNTLVSQINSKFGNLQEMNLTTTSPLITDCRIRVTLANIYFWQDDFGWSYQQTHSFGDYLYNKFVANQSNVLNKNNSVHIFMSEDATGRGRASGFGDKRWITTAGAYTRYLNNEPWRAANNISHELGHSFGLIHTWNGDDCDDTPNNDNCWNFNEAWSQRPSADCSTPSNNLMDYNACQCALTMCQVNIMHNALLGNMGNIGDCVISGITVINPTVLGPNVVCSNGEDYTIENIQLGVIVDWSATPSSYFIDDAGCGNSVTIEPESSSIGEGVLNFTFDWTDHGTRNVSKQIYVGKSTSLNICNITSSVYNAENILIPGSSCGSAVINNDQSVILYGNQTTLNSGLEVKLGGVLEIQSPSVCD